VLCVQKGKVKRGRTYYICVQLGFVGRTTSAYLPRYLAKGRLERWCSLVGRSVFFSSSSSSSIEVCFKKCLVFELPPLLSSFVPHRISHSLYHTGKLQRNEVNDYITPILGIQEQHATGTNMRNPAGSENLDVDVSVPKFGLTNTSISCLWFHYTLHSYLL
jgi:hypothetical protein